MLVRPAAEAALAKGSLQMECCCPPAPHRFGEYCSQGRKLP